MKIISSVLLSISLLLFVLSAVSLAQSSKEKMTLEEYEIQLNQWNQREEAANLAIAEEEAKIDGLKNEFRRIETEIARLQQEIYSILGVYEADKEHFESEISQLEDQMKTLRALTPEMLANRQNDIEDVKGKLKRLKQNPMTKLEENEQKMKDFEQTINSLQAVIPKPKHDFYTVMKGDYLWKISGKKEIYNDPYKWPRIYSSNLDKIKDPDVIYPDQSFLIPRQIEKNQYLVIKGDDLSKIASQVYGDPFAWTKIYQANQNQIDDKNLIYPEQILSLPGK
ncbi:LysM peptidoglycan-binding domain-containing protein [bacterium]|nr:LysM peptidoglycan-binding domain-containing protein [bacterium]